MQESRTVYTLDGTKCAVISNPEEGGEGGSNALYTPS